MINYVRMYDIDGNLVKSWEASYTPTEGYAAYALYDVPQNVYSVEYSITVGGITNVNTKYRNLTNNYSQYYYFDNNYINTIYCSGKRENELEITKEKISNGKKLNIVEIKTQEKVMQNTGYQISEDQLFNMAKSPYIFQINGSIVKNYILDNATFEGFNTKTLDGRNTVLNLRSNRVEKRYTSAENNFYN